MKKKQIKQKQKKNKKTKQEIEQTKTTVAGFEPAPPEEK